MGKLMLFHHDPAYDDEMVAENETEARKRFPETLAAYEGLEVDLSCCGTSTALPLVAPLTCACGTGAGSEEGRVKYVENG